MTRSRELRALDGMNSLGLDDMNGTGSLVQGSKSYE